MTPHCWTQRTLRGIPTRGWRCKICVPKRKAAAGATILHPVHCIWDPKSIRTAPPGAQILALTAIPQVAARASAAMAALQHLRSVLRLDSCTAILQWGLAEPAAEAPREMARVREPTARGYFSHWQIVQAAVSHQVAGTPQTQFHQPLHEGCASPGECVVNSPSRDPEFAGDARR